MFGHEEAVCKIVAAFEQCLGIFRRDSKEFLRRYVTVDETGIHYYTSETRNQSRMWTGPGESAPKKAKSVPSAGKVMATIFWDSHGILGVLVEVCRFFQ